MTTSKQVVAEISKFPIGEPFTTAQFLHLGTRAAVDQTLYRLAKRGEITRVCRGVYVKPKMNPYIGNVVPAVSEIARAKARSQNATLAVSGPVAAHNLGLTTQVPMKAVYLTNSSPTNFKVGKIEVEFKRVSPRHLVLAGTNEGMAYSALRYLGKEAVGTEELMQIRARLTECEFNSLMSARKLMPSWMADRLTIFERKFCDAA